MKKILAIILLLLPLMTYSQGSTDFDNWTYNGDKSITEYTIPDGVRRIASWAFDGCKNLQTITIPESVEIIDYWAFRDCNSLTSITIPKNVKTISGSSFWTCSKLQSLIIENGVENISSFGMCRNLESIIIPGSVKTISERTFEDLSKLKTVSLGEGIEVIGDSAFVNCTSLESITLPKSLKSIGAYAFLGCSNLKEIIIPKNVESIGESAFELCTNLKSVFLSENIKEIKGCAFSSCYNLQYFEVEEQNKYFSTIDGVLFSYDKTKLVCCPNRNKYIIPSDTKTIGLYAFQGCCNLTQVNIPKSVEIIEEGAFSYCTGLTSIIIPKSVLRIGSAAFWHSDNLRTISLPKGLKSIERSTFRECTNLSSLTLPENISSIGDLAFFDCKSLSSVNIPDGVEKIGEMAFAKCNSLKSIHIPHGVKKISYGAFALCANLGTILIDEGVEIIESLAFHGCTALSKISLPSSINTVGDNVFSNELSITCDTSALSQLIKYKCLVDVGIKEEQFDSTHNYILKMGDLLSNKQHPSPYFLTFYNDIIKFYHLINDFGKVRYFCEEALAINLPPHDSIGSNDYLKQRCYYDLQLADIYLSMREYDKAKYALSWFQSSFCDVDTTLFDYDAYVLFSEFGPVFVAINKDENLGMYYYYLIIKLYNKLSEGYFDNDDFDYWDIVDYTDNDFEFDNIIQGHHSSRYYLNVVLYRMKMQDKSIDSNWFESVKKYLKNQLNQLGSVHSVSHEILSSVADIHYHRTEYDSAFAYYTKSFEYEFQKLKQQFSYMNIYQRQYYWEEHKPSFDNIVKISTKLPDYEIAFGMAYNSLLISKGLLLASEESLSNTILNSEDEKLKSDYYKLKYYRTQIDTITNPTERDRLVELAGRLETDLMHRSSQFADVVNYMSVDWQKVRNSLGKNDVVIEFFFNDADSLYALVLKRDFDSPKLISLSDFSKIKDTYYSTTDVYNAVWKPLEQYFSTDGKVYFSPSGQLYNIAIEYAPIDEHRTISQKYKIYRISSTRLLALNKVKSKTTKTAAVFGGIKYNFGKGDWLDLKEFSDSITVAFRDVPIIGDSTLRSGVTFLPGSQLEYEAVSKILKEADYQLVDNTTGITATEELFKKLSGQGIGNMLISTHGFYQPKDTVVNNSYEREDITLSQSGLLLAGANSALDPKKRKDIPEGVDDGILTAKEISRLDFKGLDLVVLSACQTGLGEVTSEGVFGLQRGFKKAGAHTIVMSLWKVDDNATKDLMTEFYKNLVNGKSKREAFISAQEFLRKKYQDPRKWAAFVMVDGVE